MSTLQDVHSLLETHEQYDAEIAPPLVRSLHATIREGDFDLDVAHAILRLYRCHPWLYDVDTTAAILMCAMTLPENAFSLCLCLIKPDNLKHPTIQTVTELHHLLETCDFDKFWETLRSNDHLLEAKLKAPKEYEIPTEEEYAEAEAQGEELEPRLIADEEVLTCRLGEFRKSILEYVADVIKMTYQTVPSSLVRRMAGGIQDDSLQAYVTKNGWSFKDDQTIFVSKQEDSIKSKDIIQTVHFSNLVDLMANAQM
eukprot:m.233272 g.233272  ORF g.233272 m.233272 type:complete len:255 (+) comp17082_c4_seq1:85-849(+)